MTKPAASLNSEARDLSNEARALMNATADVVGEQVETARNRLAEALDSSKELYGRVREKAVKGAKATDELIHEHPYQSIAIGIGIGAVLGYLLARRSRD